MKTKQDLYRFVCDYYENHGIPYRRYDDSFMTLTVDKEREIPVNLLTAAQESPLSLILRGQLPFIVPEHQREMLVMALQAVNQRLTAGRYQMDAEGMLYYRITLPLVGIRVDEEWLENVLKDVTYYITSRDEKILALIRGEMTFDEFEKQVR